MLRLVRLVLAVQLLRLVPVDLVLLWHRQVQLVLAVQWRQLVPEDLVLQ